MIYNKKIGGAALITAVLLMITRMIPIFASGMIAFDEFPPETATGTLELAVNARSGWELSHLMLLAALLLFFIGYTVVYQELRKRGPNIRDLSAFIVLGTGLLFYALAGVIDGFLVPVAANQVGFLAEVPAESVVAFVGLSHETALAFFGQAQTAIVLGIGLISLALSHTDLVPRSLAAAGAALAGLALVGLVAGVFGAHWRTFATTGPVMMLFFLWQLALGIAMVRSRTATPADANTRLQQNPA